MLNKEEVFYHKVATDRQFFFENFLKIRNKKSELVPFKMNDAQKEFGRIIDEDRKNGKPGRYIILKARQLGMSTFTEAEIFWQTITHTFTNALILAHEEAASQNLYTMSKLYFEELPDVLKPMVKYANGKNLVFENPSTDPEDKRRNPGLRSKIAVATAGSGEVGRSSTTHLLHSSETAFYPDAKTTMLGLLQAIPDSPHTFVVMESTANGIGDYFHDMWQKATRGDNEFTPIFFPWYIDPLYTRAFRSDAEREQFISEVESTTTDHNGKKVHTYEHDVKEKYNLTYEQLFWRKWTIANKCGGDEILFMQEYPITAEEAFISSGRPKFSIQALRKYQTITKEPVKRGYLFEEKGEVIFVEDAKGYISIWEDRKPGRRYSIGADVAEGLVDGDFSCAIVGSDQFNVVAMWHGHIDPDLFGNEIVKLARYFNDAYVGVESNNHGLTTLSTIKRLEYYNLYYSKNFDKFSDTYTQKLGWTTNARTKPFMIDKLAQFIREEYLGIYADLIIGEMFTYIIEDNGSTNAQQGCHDDTVMATGIMLQLLLENYGIDYVPEIPVEKRHLPEHNTFEIIDPLFEEDKEQEEVAD